MSEIQNYFAVLNKIDCSKHVEKKNGLSYLSWPWAWGTLKELFPDSTYAVIKNAEGWNYHTDGRTAWVECSVTVEGITHTEHLPIMDNRNRSILLENIDSFAVNKSIQRCLTKAVARHGLGLYIYAGEDLPEEVKEEKAKAKQKKADTVIVNGKELPRRYYDACIFEVDGEKLLTIYTKDRERFNTLGQLGDSELQANCAIIADYKLREEKNK